jgi:hypothetical protein
MSGKVGGGLLIDRSTMSDEAISLC